MSNTFWTKIDDQYYRIHNKILKYAPICKETSKVLADEESVVQIISPEKLEKINRAFGTNFMVLILNIKPYIHQQ